MGGGRFHRFDVFISVEVETRPAEIISVWTNDEAGILDNVKVDDGRDAWKFLLVHISCTVGLKQVIRILI